MYSIVAPFKKWLLWRTRTSKSSTCRDSRDSGDVANFRLSLKGDLDTFKKSLLIFDKKGPRRNSEKKDQETTVNHQAVSPRISPNGFIKGFLT